MNLTKFKIILLSVSITVLFSCIEEYTPRIEAVESNKYVVSGLLSTEDEYQIISVSLASEINDPKLKPLNDCEVKISDIKGNIFNGYEFESGKYKVRIPEDNLITGVKFKLDIITPAGTNLVSEYEELLECPDIDSVYYLRENKPTNTPDIFIKGIQFYINLDATDFENTYYKFDIEETWEYHSMYPLEWYYDGTVHHIYPPDYSNSVCWKTEKIKDIYILNTTGLQNNKYKEYPLHFVDNTTSRLAYIYSILIKQYAISKEAFSFWDQLRVNNVEQGGLYETQPVMVNGNLSNLTNPKQSVLGYFQVASVKTKRIFITEIQDLELNYDPGCGKFQLKVGLREFSPQDYPVYLLIDLHNFAELTPECIFCTLLGGTMTKPDYWPD